MIMRNILIFDVHIDILKSCTQSSYILEIELYRFWETFLVILVIYTAWVSPFEFGFLHKAKPPLSIVDNIVNGFFAVDIILTFFVAYLDINTYLLIDDRKLIAWKYASTWLAFDVISTIPSEFVQQISPSPLRTYGLFNMLRLWRLRRVSALFARYSIFLLNDVNTSPPSLSCVWSYPLLNLYRLEKDRNFNYFWVRCAKLICVSAYTFNY